MNSYVDQAEDIGFALTVDQQHWLDALPACPDWSQAATLLKISVQGRPDPARLSQALERLVERHPILAGRLGTAPGYRGMRQFIGARRPALTLAVQAETGAPALLKPWLQQRFEIDQLPAAQALLVPAADAGQWHLWLGVAGFACDAAGMAMLYRDLAALYDTPAVPDEDLPEAFGQYLEWRAEVAQDEDAAAARGYWQGHLMPTEQGMSAPWPAYRQDQPATHQAHHQVNLPLALQGQLQRLADARQASLDTLLQAAWWALLGRLGDSNRLLGAWQHDARQDYDYFANSAGAFSKLLPLCLQWADETRFGEHLAALGAALEQHVAWQEYWVPEWVPTAVPTVAFSTTPALAPQVAGGLCWQGELLAPRLPTGIELQLRICPAAGADQPITVSLDYLAGRYSARGMQGLLEQYIELLRSIVQAPDRPLRQLNLLGEAERQRLLSINPAPQPLAETSLAAQISQWAIDTPDALALVAGDAGLSYAQLELAVQRLALALQQAGVQPGAVLALALPRSLDWVVAMLASWRVGAAYLALEPHWPVARQVRLMTQAGATQVLVEPAAVASLREQGIEALSLDSLYPLAVDTARLQPHAASASDAAYVLFTSGSTGTPKGVVVEHRQLLNYTAGVCHTLALEGCRHFAFGSTVSADLGHTTLFAALYVGATLHVAADEVMKDAELFAAYLEQQAIDCLKIVPSHLGALLESKAPAVPATVILGGEAPSAALLQRLLQIRPDCKLFNHYGPTETTVGVMVHPVRAVPTGTLGLSQVLPNNQVYVLDQHLQLAVTGVLGELYVGGQQVCRGYLQDVQSDPPAFVESPFVAGERLYRTGDLARYRPDGAIELQGRRDHQVKIRGFRIELAEIEAQLSGAPQVVEAAVLCDGEALSAYVSLRDEATVAALDAVREYLARQLPAVMLPRTLQALPRLPRLGNGKLDRQALRQVGNEPVAGLLAPRDALETVIAQRMAQLLGLEQVGIEQDFFALGGHSLLVIKLAAGIRKLLQCDINPGVIFDHATVATLAQALREREANPGQLLKLAQARLRLDSMSPEEKARLLEKSR
ncbi:amino acid adenylation domain-containing protein [Pseudomonas sp. DCB_CB]|uniref:non-ribosomal peptide synthetase n=1 Tax=Pseudomonas TaxID=286 RepID=UPI000BF20AF1|nr:MULTISPECIES: amino acid adenylation domain-containing protein [Pseudomonas]MCX2694769.1 amino acid adenylation domain-containing protein [Pseudomonas sp. DCB_BZ]MCX2859881.1 amino acid adenylation domain-containing protein [Pseudomonas sp. DCB_CB]MDD2024091.1 amino acid adenylation domain-containing protein [Pseudomonas putida]PEI11174.1 non-ribosomal peptide synthetase [Pseudomonas putida]